MPIFQYFTTVRLLGPLAEPTSAPHRKEHTVIGFLEPSWRSSRPIAAANSTTGYRPIGKSGTLPIFQYFFPQYGYWARPPACRAHICPYRREDTVSHKKFRDSEIFHCKSRGDTSPIYMLLASRFTHNLPFHRLFQYFFAATRPPLPPPTQPPGIVQPQSTGLCRFFNILPQYGYWARVPVPSPHLPA